MLDESEFTRWSAAAEDARKAASVQADAGGHNWACFPAEQAALADADHALSFVANAWLGLQESASELDDERAGDS
jgi:HEPN domain-containing protein